MTFFWWCFVGIVAFYLIMFLMFGLLAFIHRNDQTVLTDAEIEAQQRACREWQRKKDAKRLH